MTEKQYQQITIIDRIVACGVETSKHERWSLGEAVRQRYEEIFGQPPIKGLRPKTSGSGSHCFALYPHHFAGEIDRIIQSFELERSRQSRFDFPEDE